MPVATHLSASQINLYLQCSLKYRFSYIDGIEPPFKPAGLAFGGTIHSALEWLHRQRKEGHEFSLEGLLRVFNADWYAQNLSAVKFHSSDTRESLAQLGAKLLALYLQHLPPAKPVQVEYPFEVPLVHPQTHEVLDLELRGVIDLIEDSGVIVDHKTSGRSLDETTVNGSLQFTAYSYAFRYLFGRAELGIRVDNLVKTKQPRMEQIRTSRTERDHIRLFRVAEQVLRGLDASVFFPNPGWMCSDCEHVVHCNNWQR